MRKRTRWEGYDLDLYGRTFEEMFSQISIKIMELCMLSKCTLQTLLEASAGSVVHAQVKGWLPGKND